MSTTRSTRDAATRRPRLGALQALLGADAAGVRQSLVALALNSSTSLIAGAILGSITGTFERFPGLLVLVPAAIGLRGNIFGTFGNRISTAIHTGSFRMSTRPDTVLGQNVLAAGILTLSMSLALAIVAKAIAAAFGLSRTIPFLDLALISVAGGTLASAAVLAGSLALAGGAVRYGWDLDNVTAPLVSTMGDVLTLPALWAATFLVGYSIFTPTLSTVLAVAAVVALGLGWRVTSYDQLRRIVRESVPILLVAASVSAMAGIVLEKRFESFSLFPALLVMVPAHLSSAGALGGILSGRLSSKLFLGVIEARPTPSRPAQRDMVLVVLLAIPVYALNAIGAHAVSAVIGRASPGIGLMMAASLMGGLLAMLLVVAIAYYGTIVALRAGVDPDTYGIPLVSSTVDFVGAFSLILAIVLLGLT
jgi:mgtE-like transporter